MALSYKRLNRMRQKVRYHRKYRIKVSKRASKSKGVGKGKIGNSVVFPPRKFVTFSVSGQETLTFDGTGNLKYFTIRANNARDAQAAVGGPYTPWYSSFLGPDQNVYPYSQYRVHGSRIKCIFLSNNSTSGAFADIGIYARDEAELPITTSQDLYTKQFTKHGVLGSGYSSRGIQTLKYALNKKQLGSILGIKDIATTGATSAFYSTDPVAEVMYDVMAFPMISDSEAVITVRWTIEYDTELFDVNTYIAPII